MYLNERGFKSILSYDLVMLSKEWGSHLVSQRHDARSISILLIDRLFAILRAFFAGQ